MGPDVTLKRAKSRRRVLWAHLCSLWTSGAHLVEVDGLVKPRREAEREALDELRPLCWQIARLEKGAKSAKEAEPKE